MLKCSSCSQHIPISKVRNKFKCSHCQASLKSNFIWVAIFLVLGWSIVISPLAAYMAPGICEESSTCYGLVEAGIGIALLFPAIPFLLKVKLDTKDQEEEQPVNEEK